MSEWVYALTVKPYLFIGKKPVAVILENEHIAVKTWREVYVRILTYCNQDTRYHERLLYLRGRVLGKVRVLLSDKPNGMTRPHKIDDALYCEVHYGSQTLMYILVNRILAPLGFDCSSVKVVVKTK